MSKVTFPCQQFQKYVKSIRLRPLPVELSEDEQFQKYVKSIRLRPFN